MRALLIGSFAITLSLLGASRAEAQLSFGAVPVWQTLQFDREQVTQFAAVNHGEVIRYRLADLPTRTLRLNLGDAVSYLTSLRDAALLADAREITTRRSFAAMGGPQVGLRLLADVPTLGLRSGDEVVALDGWGLASFDFKIEYPEYLASLKPGDGVELVYYRDGHLHRLRIWTTGSAAIS